MIEAEERAAVVKAALSYEKSPWIHMGRARGGVDCAGLILVSFEDAGLIPHVDTGYYPKDHMMHRDNEIFLGWVEKFARKVEGRAPLPGDIALYRHGRCISHGAIVIKWPVILHALAASSQVERADSDKGELASRYKGVWSLNNWS